MSPVGMSFDPRFPLEEWRELGARIALRASASHWWLGDWLTFGQEKYGRRYKEGVALTGLDYQTLRNYAVVARSFELSRRRDKLSFQHHAEVCALDRTEQDHWLQRAECAGWSRNELRKRLRNSAAQRSRVMPTPLQLAVDPDRRELWHQAALREDCDLEAWVVRTLDEAARTAVRHPVLSPESDPTGGRPGGGTSTQLRLLCARSDTPFERAGPRKSNAPESPE